MLFITRRSQRLFSPSGYWSRSFYVLPDRALERRIKAVAWLFGFLFVSAIVVAAIFEHWLYFLVVAAVLLYLQFTWLSFLCRDCDKVDEKYTFQNAIEDFASGRKRHELWISATALPIFTIYLGWQTYNETNEIIMDAIAVSVLSIISVLLVYALIVRERKA